MNHAPVWQETSPVLLTSFGVPRKPRNRWWTRADKVRTVLPNGERARYNGAVTFGVSWTHDKIRAISNEMSALLEKQSNALRASPVSEMREADMNAYHERDQRIRDLCQELAELT